jgi:hypothetical protein
MRAFSERCRLLMAFLIGAILGGVVQAAVVPTESDRENPHAQPVTASADPNELRWDLAKGFEFDWESVELSSEMLKDSTVNGETRTLTIHVKVGILDAKGLISVDVNTPEVSEVYDDDGRMVEHFPNSVSPVRRYEQSGWYWDDGRARPPRQWYPGSVMLQLPSDLNHPVPSSISRLTAYIYVIYGEVVNVDVPFDASAAEWKEFNATAGLLFRVDPSTPPRPGPIEYDSGPRSSGRKPKAPVALYRFTTWVKSVSGGSVMALRDEFPWYPRRLYPLGDYAIVRTDLFDSENEISALLPPTSVWQSILGDPAGSLHYGARCWGQMEQDDRAYDTIRHIIAVHPVEVKIPFVLNNIPVPKIQ